MTEKPVAFDTTWRAYFMKKYKGKSISPVVAHNERVELEEKYGKKIILGKLEDMVTDQEKMAFVEYHALGDAISSVSPDYKKATELYEHATADQSRRKNYWWWRLLEVLYIFAHSALAIIFFLGLISIFTDSNFEALFFLFAIYIVGFAAVEIIRVALLYVIGIQSSLSATAFVLYFLSEWFGNDQKKKEREEREKQISEGATEFQNTWSKEYNHLVKAGKVPKIVDVNDPNDPGVLAKRKILLELRKQLDANEAAGIDHVPTLKEIFYSSKLRK